MSGSGLLPSEAFTAGWRARQQERSRTAEPFGKFGLRIPEPDVGRLSMERMPFQREIYMDTGDLRELIINKGTQVGMSTTFVRWALWVAGELAGRILYVMPTQDIAYDFSDDRVKRLMETDALADRIPDGGTQNKGLKRLGRGMIYFRGSMTAKALDNIPARALVLDEYDELAQENIPVVEARVGAQEDPLIRRLGVPTLQGTGIDRMYRTTDMRRWLVKCDRCGTWQRITFENLRWEEVAPQQYEAWRVCVGCDESIEQLLRGGAGEWVPEYPDRPRRGYHIPRLIVPRADMGTIVAAHLSGDETKLQNHYNRDLAEPFETPDQRLSVDAIQSCRVPGVRRVESYAGWNPVTMGIDQAAARPLNVRISEHLNPREKRVLALIEVPIMAVGANPDQADQSALRRLAELMQVFKVNMACIDHLPDGIFARAFCAAHPGRAYMVAYNTAPTAKNSIVVPQQSKPTDLLVTVKRTEWIGATLDLLRHQRNLLPKEEPLPTDYEDHLRAAIKVRRKDNHEREFYVYETSGADDWLHAEVYDSVATEVLKLRMLEGSIDAAVQSQRVEPEHPTPDFNDWEGKPWNPQDPAGGAQEGGDPYGTYGPGWGNDYRP